MRRFTLLLVAVLAAAFAAGCASDINEVKLAHETFVPVNVGRNVYVDVRNPSSVQDFPIRGVLCDKMRNEGYTVVNKPSEASVLLVVLIRFCGLQKDAFKADGVVGGAVGGGVVGGIAGSMSQGGASTAIGALAGMAIGAGVGALAEEEARKTTFMGIVDFEIKPKGGATMRNKVVCRVREKGLTSAKAVDMICSSIGTRIAGLFPKVTE